MDRVVRRPIRFDFVSVCVKHIFDFESNRPFRFIITHSMLFGYCLLNALLFAIETKVNSSIIGSLVPTRYSRMIVMN